MGSVPSSWQGRNSLRSILLNDKCISNHPGDPNPIYQTTQVKHMIIVTLNWCNSKWDRIRSKNNKGSYTVFYYEWDSSLLNRFIIYWLPQKKRYQWKNARGCIFNLFLTPRHKVLCNLSFHIIILTNIAQSNKSAIHVLKTINLECLFTWKIIHPCVIKSMRIGHLVKWNYRTIYFRHYLMDKTSRYTPVYQIYDTTL